MELQEGLETIVDEVQEGYYHLARAEEVARHLFQTQPDSPVKDGLEFLVQALDGYSDCLSVVGELEHKGIEKFLGY